jgi:sugar transferase (PEP-CTERM/EpsH1 system associated)
MNLLVLTPRFPYPPVRGDCIRAWGEIEHLSKRHNIWLACVDRAKPWPANHTHVRKHCRAVAVAVRSHALSLLHGGAALTCGSSLTKGYFRDARLVRTVREWAGRLRFDAVLTFSSAMAPYAELVPAPRRVLDMNDVDSAKWRVYAGRSLPPLSWLYALESRRLAAAELRWSRAHDRVLLVNERERKKLTALDATIRSEVVRTGVDLNRYEGIWGSKRPDRRTAQPIVGMLGSMSYSPNVRAVNWFGRQVWPLIRRALPAAQWVVVGSRPTRSVRAWRRLHGVTVTGFVQDVRPHLTAMRVFVNAVRDEIGVQTKLIEAMAAGKAAVVAPESAAGIDYTGEPPFLIAATPGEFADAVLRVLRDAALAERLGMRARQVAQENYRVQDQVRRIEQWLQADSDDVAPRAHNGQPAAAPPAEPVNA